MVMPYTIKTKDGITLKNIPDDIDPNSEALKARVNKIRAERNSASPVSNLVEQGNAAVAESLPPRAEIGANLQDAANKDDLSAMLNYANQMDASRAQQESNKRASLYGGSNEFNEPAAELVSKKEPTLGQRLYGTGEAALSGLTGMTTGAVGYLGGVLGGGAAMMGSGLLGTQEGNDLLRRSAMEGAERLTYVPKSEQGIAQVESLGKALGNIAGIAPLSEFSAMAASVPKLGGRMDDSIRARTGGKDGNAEFLKNAEDVIALGEKEGVKVYTSDIFPPKSAVGKVARATGEKVPFVGMSEPRVVQYQKRIDALKNTLDEYGASYGSNASELVMKDMLEKRGGIIEKNTALKNSVLNKIDAKTKDSGVTVPVDKTTAAIDSQIASLSENSSNPIVAKLISDLDEFKNNIQGKSLAAIERERSLLGAEYKKPEMAHIRGLADKSISSLYAPLKEDMGAFIKEHGDKGVKNDFAKWEIANRNLSENIKEMDKAIIKRTIDSGDVTPENVNSLIFSKKESDVSALYRSLTPEGRKNVEVALLHKAANDSMSKGAAGSEFLSPDQFVNNYRKLSMPLEKFMTKEKKAEMDGLVRLLAATERSAQAGVSTMSGQEGVVANTGTALVVGLGGGLKGLAGAAGIGLGARLYESPVMRGLFMRMAKTKEGSAEEASILSAASKEIKKQNSLIGATVVAAQAENERVKRIMAQREALNKISQQRESNVGARK